MLKILTYECWHSFKEEREVIVSLLLSGRPLTSTLQTAVKSSIWCSKIVIWNIKSYLRRRSIMTNILDMERITASYDWFRKSSIFSYCSARVFAKNITNVINWLRAVFAWYGLISLFPVLGAKIEIIGILAKITTLRKMFRVNLYHKRKFAEGAIVESAYTKKNKKNWVLCWHNCIDLDGAFDKINYNDLVIFLCFI